MSKSDRRSSGRPAAVTGGAGTDDDIPGRIEAVLKSHPRGMHRLGEPAIVLDTELPAPLCAVYRCFDGAELFHETLVLVPSIQVERQSPGPAGAAGYRVGEIAGDDLVVDARGRVYRLERDLEEWLEEGSRFDRWLLGAIEAEAMVYDRDGEFLDDVFDDEGDAVPEVSERMQRAVLRRDRSALAPRWRLAQALARQGKTQAARDALEEVAAAAPGFAWAWFDLARISEELGELEAAIDELEAAADARPDHEHAGFFWAHAARVAATLGDDDRRAGYAARAVARYPDLARVQREGAAATLDAGDPAAALRLAELALAVAPRDLTVLDLLARIRAEILAREPATGQPD